jgi:magnesium-transporting ATPase (P-type)
LCQKLSVDPAKGLPKDEAKLKQRRKLFGSNKIPMKRAKNILELAWEAMKDRTLIILAAAAIVSIGLSFYTPSKETGGNLISDLQTHSVLGNEDKNGWIEGTAILVSILVVVSVTALSNYSKERQFNSLKSKIEGEAEILVLRDGQQHESLIHELVVGDILLINYGILFACSQINFFLFRQQCSGW